jgi:hypothetical protein
MVIHIPPLNYTNIKGRLGGVIIIFILRVYSHVRSKKSPCVGTQRGKAGLGRGGGLRHSMNTNCLVTYGSVEPGLK